MTIERIAIIDDDQEAAQSFVWMLEDCSYTVIRVSDLDMSVENAAEHVTSIADAALCDHRLSDHGLANFHGADLVAALYERKVPAVLITQYFDQDSDVSIRRHRDKIPVVLRRDEADTAEVILNAISACNDEIQRAMPAERVPRRALLKVMNIESIGNEKVVDVVIPQWIAHRAVRFPLSIVPQELHDRVKPGVNLYAEVNFGAISPHDLFLTNFSLAQEPDLNDGLS